MYMVKYLRADGTVRTVLVGTSDPIEAQRLAKASDAEYVRLVDSRRQTNEVWFVGDSRE